MTRSEFYRVKPNAVVEHLADYHITHSPRLVKIMPNGHSGCYDGE